MPGLAPLKPLSKPLLWLCTSAARERVDVALEVCDATLKRCVAALEPSAAALEPVHPTVAVVQSIAVSLSHELSMAFGKEFEQNRKRRRATE